MTDSTSLVLYDPRTADPELIALAGFLAGYGGRTREAYALDLRQFFAWCSDRQLRLFDAHRADIELYARDLEEHGKAKATIGRRLSTIAGFYRYAAEEGLIEHSPAVHVRRPRLDYESRSECRSVAIGGRSPRGRGEAPSITDCSFALASPAHATHLT